MNLSTNDSQDMLREGMHEMKKSGNDWLDYVQSHPLQSMVFGVIIFYALKGFLNR